MESNKRTYSRLDYLMDILGHLKHEYEYEYDVPEIVIEEMKNKIAEENINLNNLDLIQCRRLLKKLNYRKYYEYTPYILRKLTGKQLLPKIKDHDELKIIQVFKEVSKSFNYCRPPTRLNFLNYNYVLQKICIMLGLNEYLILFPFQLRNKDNILKHETIWKGLCVYNYDNWKHYPNFAAL